MNKKGAGTLSIVGIIIALIIVALILFFVLRPKIISPGNQLTKDIIEKEITNIDVSPDSQYCIKGDSPKQTFSARVSKQAPGTTYKGTFLQLSGSPTIYYVSDINLKTYSSRKLLEKDLYNLGYRILEVKFSSKTGWEPGMVFDEQWRGEGIACTAQPFVKALEVMQEQGMWPTEANDRYGLGTSNGAILWAYAVDYFKSPFAKSHRVYLESPVVYNAYGQLKEASDLIFNQFYYNGMASNPDQYKSEIEKTQIYPLDRESCNMTVGENSLLISFGTKDEVPSWYKDEKNYAADREKLCPVKTASWDVPTKYAGHNPVITYYTVKGNIDAFVNYFTNGEVNFS